MNSRRIIILLVAVVIAAAASLGLLSYVNNLETEASDPFNLEEVWVVQGAIPRGTPAQQALSQNLIARQSVPVEFIPPSAINEPEVELSGLVAVTDLPANAIVVQGNFVAPGVVNTGITDRLEEKGMVTVTFTLDQVGAAAYLIEPGDHVNILTRFDLVPEQEEDVEGGLESTETVGDGETNTNRYKEVVDLYKTDARYVYQQAEVLAVASNLTADLGEDTTAEGEAAPPPSGLITLAVPPETVQVLLSIGLDNLYLSLLPPNYVPYALPPIDLEETVLPGENEELLTPYGPPSLQAPSSEDDQ